MQTYKEVKLERALESTVWERPDSYMGYNPEGEYCIVSRHRDSSVLGISNYERIKEDVERLAESLNSRDSVYSWQASHWGVGWIEYLMLKEDSPQELKDFVSDILIGLDEYPVYDESDFSDREWNQAESVWKDCFNVRERVGLIKKYCDSDVSIFAARRDSIPCLELVSVLCE